MALQTANLEIGVPGFQAQVPTSTSEFRLIEQEARLKAGATQGKTQVPRGLF
jgi:hypothetical protein